MALVLNRLTTFRSWRFCRQFLRLAALAGMVWGLAASPAPAGEQAAREAANYPSRFYGTVESLPRERIGTWVVSGRQIMVTRETRITEKHGRPEPGAYVEVEGSNTGATFTAREISVKRAKQAERP